MTQIVTNDVSAITPEIWSSAVQKNLYKSLVALEVSNLKLSDTLTYGDTIHVPKFEALSAQTYIPGTSLSATNLDWSFDTLVVSTYKHATFYVDNVEQLQANVEQIRPLAEDAAFQLSNGIDAHVFNNLTGADGFTVFNADAQLHGGSIHRPLSSGSANIINVFGNARKLLRQNNVEEMGDWIAIVTPQIAFYIEAKATTVGFNLADATLRNGYTGDFMGFGVYISNNLPSGKCSTISLTLSTAANSATSCKSIYFGRKGMIDVVMQRRPALEIRKKDDMLGANFITWTVYGSAVFTRNRSRGLNVGVQNTFF